MKKNKSQNINASNSKKIKHNKSKEHLFTIKAMQTQIEGYGFRYSFVDFLKTTLLFSGIIIVVGYFLQMQPFYITALILAVILMMPTMIKNQFKFIYEQRRFSELVMYLEQMAYSFKKDAKILLALKDTAEVTSGKMNELVNNAIWYIENQYSDNVYEEALQMIENEYPCSRIVQLHKFLCKIEKRGGECGNSMDILIDDIASWAERTFVFQKDRNDLKKKIMISLFISMCICSTTIFMIPEDINFTTMPLYQWVTLLTLISFVGIFVFTQTKLNGSWLENDAVKDENQILKDYHIARTTVMTDALKKAKRGALLGAPIVVIGIFQQSIPIIALGGLLSFLLYNQPKNKVKIATKHTIREIEKEIPGWCREVALNLQTENVYRAIELTMEDCPIILREPLNQFLWELNNNSGSIVPYNNFLAEFNIPEVNRLMKTLYSLSEFGVQDAESQINKIIVQNNAMLEKAEELKNEDSLAGVGFITLVPMFLGSAKMLVDLFLLIGAFTSLTSQI